MYQEKGLIPVPFFVTDHFAVGSIQKQVRRDYLAWTPADKDQKEDGIRMIPQHGIEEHQNMMNMTTSHGQPVSLPEPHPPEQAEKMDDSEKSALESRGN